MLKIFFFYLVILKFIASQSCTPPNYCVGPSFDYPTIQDAIDIGHSPGDKIYIEEGAYVTSFIIRGSGGQKNNPIEILPRDNADVLLYHNYHDSPQEMVDVTVSWWKIHNGDQGGSLTFHTLDRGGNMIHIIEVGAEVYLGPFFMIYGVVIDGVDFTMTPLGRVHKYIFLVYSGNTAPPGVEFGPNKRVWIKNCIFRNAHGIFANFWGVPIRFFNDASYVTIENNYFIQTGLLTYGFIWIHAAYSGDYIRNVVIQNNVFDQNTDLDGSLYFQTGSFCTSCYFADITIQNNLFNCGFANEDNPILAIERGTDANNNNFKGIIFQNNVLAGTPSMGGPFVVENDRNGIGKVCENNACAFRSNLINGITILADTLVTWDLDDNVDGTLLTEQSGDVPSPWYRSIETKRGIGYPETPWFDFDYYARKTENPCYGAFEFPVCDGNLDPDYSCTVCKEFWLDISNDCDKCILEVTHRIEPCNGCEDHFSTESNCTECEDLWDILTNCTDCLDNKNSSNDCVGCKGNRNLENNCDTCIDYWIDLSSDCGICKLDADYRLANCSGCENDYLDVDTNCTTCINNYRNHSTKCTVCKDFWMGENCDECKLDASFRQSDCSGCIDYFTVESNCTECVGNRDILTNCTSCIDYWIDLSSNCNVCKLDLDNRLPDCSGCENGYLDVLANCTSCLNDNRNISTQCNECNDYWVGSTCNICNLNSNFRLPDCKGCKYYFTIESNCTECIGNRDIITNCTSCVDYWIDLGNNCLECRLDSRFSLPDCVGCKNYFTLESNCTECVGNRDILTNCTSCVDYWINLGSNCLECRLDSRFRLPDCVGCKDYFTVESNCTECAGNRDILTNCTSCVDYWIDLGNNCLECRLDSRFSLPDCVGCKNYFTLESNCTECIGNRDILTNCTSCIDYWIDLSSNCNVCKLDLDNRLPDCSGCENGYLDVLTNCTSCLNDNRNFSTQCNECNDYWVGSTCNICNLDSRFSLPDCVGCKNYFTLESNCTECAGNRDILTNCTSCVDFYINLNSDCNVCKLDAINSLSDCSGCKYYFTTDSNCTACENEYLNVTTGCVECININRNFSVKCVECNYGFYGENCIDDTSDDTDDTPDDTSDTSDDDTPDDTSDDTDDTPDDTSDDTDDDTLDDTSAGLDITTIGGIVGGVVGILILLCLCVTVIVIIIICLSMGKRKKRDEKEYDSVELSDVETKKDDEDMKKDTVESSSGESDSSDYDTESDSDSDD